MPLGTATITFDLSDILGADFDARRTKAWVTTNVPSETIVDVDGNKIRLGSGNVTVNADSTGTFTTWVPGAGSNPASWQTYLHVDYPDRNAPRGRGQRTFGPFTITASADLADLIDEQEVPPDYLTQATAQLDAYVTEAEVARDGAVAAHDNAVTDSVAASVIAAAGEASTAGIARAGAEAARDEAEAHAADVQAVVATSAGVVDAVLADPVSAPSVRLSATYAKRYTTIDVVADHGADRTGGTPCHAAFNAAIAAANALGGNVKIAIPQGTYDLTAGVTTSILTNYVQIVGEGVGASTLTVRNGTLFKFGNGGGASVIGGGLCHVDIVNSDTPDAGQRVIDIDGASSQKFNRINLQNICQLARLGSTTGGNASAPSFRHIYGNTAPIAGAIVIDAVKGFSLSLTDFVINSNGVGFPSDRTALHPAPAGTTFLRFGKGSWDTAHLSEITTNRYDYGLDINAAAGAIVNNMWLYGCVFDYCKTRGIRIAAGASGAYVSAINITGGWAVASDFYSVEVARTVGTITGVHFTDVSAQQAGKSNWRFTGAMSNVTLMGCSSMGGNRLTGATGLDTYDMVILTGGVSVRGGRFNDPLDMGAAGLAYANYGIVTAPDIEVVVTGATFNGATGGWDGPLNNTVADARSLVTNNRRATNAKPEYAVTVNVTVPTSGALQAHVNPTKDTLYIYGGTLVGINHNGAAVGTTGPATLTLSPGDTWSVIYTAAPTIRKSVSP